MNTPNWQHNSQKQKKGRGVAKGRLRARKQALQSLKAKYQLNNRHKGVQKDSFSVV